MVLLLLMLVALMYENFHWISRSQKLPQRPRANVGEWNKILQAYFPLHSFAFQCSTSIFLCCISILYVVFQHFWSYLLWKIAEQMLVGGRNTAGILLRNFWRSGRQIKRYEHQLLHKEHWKCTKTNIWYFDYDHKWRW